MQSPNIQASINPKMILPKSPLPATPVSFVGRKTESKIIDHKRKFSKYREFGNFEELGIEKKMARDF